MKLKHLGGWHLRVVCGRCGRIAVKDVAELGHPEAALWQTLLKLRCSALRGGRLCKGTPKTATLLQGLDTARAPRAIREIRVL